LSVSRVATTTMPITVTTVRAASWSRALRTQPVLQCVLSRLHSRRDVGARRWRFPGRHAGRNSGQDQLISPGDEPEAFGGPGSRT
jgi:hypothetical protein